MTLDLEAEASLLMAKIRVNVAGLDYEDWAKRHEIALAALQKVREEALTEAQAVIRSTNPPGVTSGIGLHHVIVKALCDEIEALKAEREK